jgi:chromate transporter
VIPAPYFRKYGRRPGITAFVDAVTAAAIGALSGAVVVLGRRSIVDLPTALLALVTVAVLWRWKLPEPILICAAALIGLLIFPG